MAPVVPGTWRRWVHYEPAPLGDLARAGAGGMRGLVTRDTVAVCCFDCGGALALPKHTISPEGRVSPSLVCTHPGCSFHDFVLLAGWPGPDLPAP